jgi:ribonucleoside-diphosphate reductase alpha chain
MSCILGVDLMDTESRYYRFVDVEIKRPDGSIVFEKKQFKVPVDWSDRAATIMASKYATDEEYSAYDIIDRVVNQITEWGKEQGYFEDDNDYDFQTYLKDILVNQRAAFNSPVWFNCGSKNNSNQMSACFIVPVEDTMESILRHNEIEGMIFRGGSGAGCNVSKLRGKGEKLSNKGTASGPISFMKMWDATAGVIKCVTGDTIVWTDLGLTTIKEATGKIATGYGYNTIVKKYRNETSKVKKVNLSYTNLSLTGTNNHPIKVMTKTGIQWKNIEDLSIGDYVAVGRNYYPEIKDSQINFKYENTNRKKEYTIPEKITPSLAYILGLWTAEGSIDDERIRITNGDEQIVDKFIEEWKSTFGYSLTKTFNKSKNCYDLQSSCKGIIELFKFLGCKPGAANKEIPELILKSSKQSMLLYLKGYFDGDGHTQSHVYATSKSKKLIDSLQHVLLAIGIVCSKKKQIVANKEYWKISFSGDGSRLFHYIIGTTSNKKSYDFKNKKQNSNIDIIPFVISEAKKTISFNQYKKGINISLNKAIEIDLLSILEKEYPALALAVKETIENNIFWDKIKTIEEQEDIETYDITVENKHSFLGNGIICHNSGGKTRRSAKLICMDVDHPDIWDFINCKREEEHKAKILIEAGIPAEDAYATVAFQNTNHSIRVSDKFMKAYEEQKEGEANWALKNRGNKEEVPFSPRSILAQTAAVAWETGDPGIQFDDRMNIDNPVPSLGRINSTNPCSEFSAVDNSSCNLASLNLVKYLTVEGDFNWPLFRDDTHVMITAMDILVDAADYPTEEIRQVTTSTRPLGLGFSNLGALLILKGYPYDSDEGRFFAKNITREMTRNAYTQSIHLAKKLGSFLEFRNNKERNLEIAMRLTDTDETGHIWQEMKEYGLRNSQVTLLAPTGTISFMMDCDTTGIEPLFALKTYKQLAGGGTLEIDYPCVDKAKEKYTNPEVFKTANEIPWHAHIDMMAVCQQHLNGAISKTVNMPQDCTQMDIREAYIYAWKSGLKALAIYRDGSKSMQPMTAAKPAEEIKVVSEMKPDNFTDEKWCAVRRKLPDTVTSLRHKFNIGGFEGYLHCGVYEDGSLGELFVIAEKMGSTMQGFLDAFATSVSLGLQYGVPLEKLIDKFSGTRFDPAGFTTNPDIQLTTSVIDYIFRWLELQFIDKEEDIEDNHYMEERTSYAPAPVKVSFDGPPCPHCGSITGKVGTCFLCRNCGETTGCS